MRAVVTGGAGFIGSHVAEGLLARGDEVHVLDDLSAGKRENVASEATFHEADIRDPEDAFDAARPEVVFHLAAQASVSLSVQKPELDADVNVIGTVRVLEAARRHGAHVVFSSTGGAIYGECDGPAPETAERRPISPYGISKLAGEEYLGGWNRLFGSQHVALRFANVYGPRQEASLEGGVVAIFLERMAAGEGTQIFGDGRQTRDYIYVGDLVDAAVAAGESDVRGAINIGTEEETTVLELIEAVRAAGGERDGFEPEFEPARTGELDRSCLSVTRARETLGWGPRVDVREGIRRTLEAAHG